MAVPSRLWKVVGVMAVGLTLAACNSSGGQGSGGGGSTLRVMAMAPEDTPIENVPEAVAGVQAAVNYINDHGGMQGHKVEVDYCNPQVDPNAEMACARKAKSNGDIALVGAVQYVGTALWPILESQNIASIGQTPVSPIDYQTPVNFPIDSGSILGYAGDAVVMARLGVDRVATGTLQLAAGIDNANSTKDLINRGQLKTPDGRQLVFAGQALVTQTQSNFAPSAQSVKQLNVTGVINELGPQQAVQLITAVKQLGLNPILAANSGSFSAEDLKSAAALLEGSYIVGGLPPVNADAQFPGIAEFKSQMAAAQSAGVKDVIVDNASLNAWLSVYGLKAAVESIKGDVSSKAVLDALRALPPQKIQGFVDWTPAAPGPIQGYPRATNLKLYVMKVHNGELQLLSPQTFDLAAALSGSPVSIPGLP